MGIGVLLVDSKCLIKKVSLSLGSSSRTMEGSQVWLLNSDDSEPSKRPSEDVAGTALHVGARGGLQRSPDQSAVSATCRCYRRYHGIAVISITPRPRALGGMTVLSAEGPPCGGGGNAPALGTVGGCAIR